MKKEEKKQWIRCRILGANGGILMAAGMRSASGDGHGNV